MACIEQMRAAEAPGRDLCPRAAPLLVGQRVGGDQRVEREDAGGHYGLAAQLYAVKESADGRWNFQCRSALGSCLKPLA
jgi:hypothetical protein